MTLIAGEVLHLIPQALDGIEFGTVGRQGQQMNPCGQVAVLRPRVETGLIPDHHVLRARIAGGNLPEKVPTELQTTRGHEPELGVPFQHLQGPINIFPFIALLLRDHHPLPAQGPTTPALGMQGQAALTERPWHQTRERVQVKILPQAGELYVLVQSGARVDKERAIRRRRLKKLWQRLRQLQTQRPGYERLLLELGAAKKDAGRGWSLVAVDWPEPPPACAKSRRVTFTFRLRKDALRKVRRREGRYLLRSNLTAADPAQLWEFYLQLIEIEAAFKNLWKRRERGVRNLTMCGYPGCRAGLPILTEFYRLPAF